jgi:uncharacterized RDD family membrane protein YckC
LRDALLPFSSVIPEPATQAQRGAAGWIDYLTAFLPTYATLMITVGPEKLFVRPLFEFSLAAWQYHFMVLGAGFLYFTLTEGLWGAGIGKWIMNLRVVKRNGKRPGLGRALLRILIPFAAIELLRVPLSVLLVARWRVGPDAQPAHHRPVHRVSMDRRAALAHGPAWERDGNGVGSGDRHPSRRPPPRCTPTGHEHSSQR